MPFKKGHSGYKPKGKRNKKTQEFLSRFEKVLNLLDETICQDIAELEPIERAKMWNDLQEYIRPKLARTELTGQDGDAIQVRSFVLGKASDRNK